MTTEPARKLPVLLGDWWALARAAGVLALVACGGEPAEPLFGQIEPSLAPDDPRIQGAFRAAPEAAVERLSFVRYVRRPDAVTRLAQYRELVEVEPSESYLRTVHRTATFDRSDQKVVTTTLSSGDLLPLAEMSVKNQPGPFGPQQFAFFSRVAEVVDAEGSVFPLAVGNRSRWVLRWQVQADTGRGPGRPGEEQRGYEFAVTRRHADAGHLEAPAVPGPVYEIEATETFPDGVTLRRTLYYAAELGTVIGERFHEGGATSELILTDWR